MHAVNGRTVMALGATGLVGNQLMRQLVADARVGRVVVPARRRIAPMSAVAGGRGAKLDVRLVDFDDLEASAEAFNGVEQIFCALGTTIRQAGSQEQFRRVDHDYPLAAARLGLQLGASDFLLVSAIGADPGSRIFYNRVKGEVERAIIALGYDATTIVRPSLLLGDRAEVRRGEQVAKWFAWATPRRWKPVEASDVAAALVAASHEGRMGVRIIESREIARH